HTKAGYGSGFIPIAEYGADFAKASGKGKAKKAVRLLSCFCPVGWTTFIMINTGEWIACDKEMMVSHKMYVVYEPPNVTVQPCVMALQIRLPNKQMVRFTEDDTLTDIVDRERDKRTMLTAFFETNKFNVYAKQYLYKDFPNHFTWNKTTRRWNPRKRGSMRGRLVSVNLAEGERFYMRLLLTHVCGPTDWKDLYSVNNVLYQTFRRAALERGLIENDNALSTCLALLAKVRSCGLIALAIASSGAAANNMPGGRTAHSRFKIPINLENNSRCNIKKQSGTAKLLRASKLIILDESSMAKRQAVEVNGNSSDFIIPRAILSTKNEHVDELNDKLIDRVCGDEKIYYSFDAAQDDKNNLYPMEFLNSLNVSGLPPHVLRLKIGCLRILLQNLDPSDGLCNGTRLICQKFKSAIFDAKIVVGQHAGKQVFFPRIPLSPSKADMFPFKLKRTQFPVRLSFAMTINKAQGQTIPNVGVYLPEPFSHTDNFTLPFQEEFHVTRQKY
nr:hypothetical protein [Tanacetum cinerariifolium]